MCCCNTIACFRASLTITSEGGGTSNHATIVHRHIDVWQHIDGATNMGKNTDRENYRYLTSETKNKRLRETMLD